MGVSTMGDLLTGKTAIVTGSSRGIGRAIAIEFARQGADVVINFVKSRAEAEEVAAHVESLGRKALLVQASVDNREGVETLFAKVREQFERLDILVNNAGIVADGLLLTLNENAWNRVLNTNLGSVYYCSKAAMRLMNRQRDGCIVNIASLSGIAGRPGQCNYAASKGGMIAFTKSLAHEAGHFNVRVNAIAPGPIQTDILGESGVGTFDLAAIPLGRLGSPEEVAKVAVFLVSDMASYVTGTVVNVSGGLYM